MIEFVSQFRDLLYLVKLNGKNLTKFDFTNPYTQTPCSLCACKQSDERHILERID